MTVNKIMKLKGQKLKVLRELEKGEWVNGRYLSRELYLSQYHTRIHELKNLGYEIKASDFKDEYGFKSYKLLGKPEQQKLI